MPPHVLDGGGIEQVGAELDRAAKPIALLVDRHVEVEIGDVLLQGQWLPRQLADAQ